MNKTNNWEVRKGDVLNPNRTYGIVVPLSREACIQIDGDDSLFGKRTEVIAEVCYASNGIDEKDAHLMAAAPDLLDALEKCSALLDLVITRGQCASFADITGGNLGNILDPAAKARAAIAKATQL